RAVPPAPRAGSAGTAAEPLAVHGVGDRASRARRAGELLERVGLTPEHAARHPHQVSGGPPQRTGLARALARAPTDVPVRARARGAGARAARRRDPRLLVGAEPVSALDVSIQAQILNLML